MLTAKMNAFEFMTESPFLTFFLAYLLAELFRRNWKMAMRCLMVRKHGWPPPHLDADGDAVEQPPDERIQNPQPAQPGEGLKTCRQSFNLDQQPNAE